MSTILHMKLKRVHHGEEYAVGRLIVDNEWQCFTLEDKVREKENKPVESWKVYGKTAIPRGTYEVIVSFSNRFQKPLPLLKDVPGFSGIRIHPGNKSSNTEGCILVGQSWEGGDWIGHSKNAFDSLFRKIQNARSEGKFIFLEVE